MTTTANTTKVHDLALEMYRHLKDQDKSPARTQHIFRMICAVERAAAGVLDESGEAQAFKEIEQAALFFQPK
jgi:hypothetical protein